MFVVTVEFVIHAGQEGRFLARMKQQAEDSLKLEPECHQFDVCRDPDRADTIFLYELYSDEAAFKVHLNSDHFKSFDAEVAKWVAGKTVRTWRRETA